MNWQEDRGEEDATETALIRAGGSPLPAKSRWQALLEHMLEGVAHCRMVYRDGLPWDFVYLEVNPAFGRLTGLHDVVGRRVSEVIPGIRDTNPEFLEACGRVARNGQPDRLEVEIASPGVWFSVLVYSPASDHFVAVFDNITERRKAEEALRESSEVNRQVLDSVGEGVVVYGPDLRYRLWNPYMEELTGLPAADVLGRHPLEVFPFLKDFGISEQLERALAGEVLDPIVLRHEPPFSTREGWSSNASSPLRDTRGAIVGVITTVRDVTKEREDAESLRKLTQAIEQSPAAVVITDPDGNIEFVNPRFCRMTGYSSEEVLGRNPRLLKGDTSPQLFQDLWKTIKAGQIWGGEFHNRRKDGTLYWEHATISPIKNLAGETTHYLALKEDISDRKLLEAQLQQAQRMEAVGRLAGGIAHDFNNMLTVILNYAELTMYPLDPQDPTYANVLEIRKAAERSAELTRQLLAFSRKQIVEPQNVNLNTLIHSEEKMLGRLIGEDVAVEFKPGDDLWAIFIDPSQVDQVLTNLAVNARDAIAGVGTITVETKNVVVSPKECQSLFLKPGEYVRLTFADTGCGMDEGTAERIFEPFFTTKETGKGTGLGLSTVYGIVKQNKGSVLVDSAPGRGTTFRLYFPRFVERRKKPRITQTGEVPHGTETVLVVEDEPRILELARTILEYCGYRVLTASSPREALDLCGDTEETIHLLLTDVVMPLMNGKELQSRIRSLRPGIKTLFMSGYTADAIAPYGVLEEGVNLLHKPFNVTSLAERVRRTLDEEEGS